MEVRENLAEGSGAMDFVEDPSREDSEDGSGGTEFCEDEYAEEGSDADESSWDESEFRPPKMYRFDDPPFQHHIFKGEMLIEIFSIQFLDYKQVYSAQPYGVIFLRCGSWPHVLFEHTPGEPLPIDDNGFLQLNDPDRARIAGDDCVLCSFLSCLDERVEIFYHSLFNTVQQNYQLLFNRLLTRSFDTKFGDIELNYAVFTESVTATLEIKLLDSKHDQGMQRSENIEVFGLVTAGSDTVTDEKAKICMFKRDKDACAVVKRGETIPLSRCKTVCPLESNVVFHLSLYHRNESGDDAHLIMNRVVAMDATIEEDVLTLDSDFGCMQIQLKATCGNWSGLEMFPFWLEVP